ncbi:unnamed protein product [Boreogadus saida]
MPNPRRSRGGEEALPEHLRATTSGDPGKPSGKLRVAAPLSTCSSEYLLLLSSTCSSEEQLRLSFLLSTPQSHDPVRAGFITSQRPPDARSPSGRPSSPSSASCPQGEGAIGSLDYTPEERRSLAKKSQDFRCEACECSMRTALLPPSPDRDPRPEDSEAQELAQQISFKADSRQASESGGATSDPPAPDPAESSSPGERDSSEDPLEDHEDQVESSSPSPPPPAGRPLSPRQRRAHQARQRREPPPAPHPEAARRTLAGAGPEGRGQAGTAVLILVLTLALAALIFRRLYQQEFKLDYQL